MQATSLESMSRTIRNAKNIQDNVKQRGGSHYKSVKKRKNYKQNKNMKYTFIRVEMGQPELFNMLTNREI